MTKNSKLPAIILAGGLGTRLRSIEAERPKPMVEILSKPFLYWLILSLQKVGFQHFIFSLGYKADYIADYPWSKMFPTSKFEFSTEEVPLGTGGAVKNIFTSQYSLESAWVINGDTLLENPLSPVKPSNDAVLYTALSPKNVFDAKSNLVTEGDRVVTVSDSAGQFFDGGQVFITRQAVESYFGKTPCSFHQLVEKSFTEKKVGFIKTPGTCYDIGTPERLIRFETYLRRASLKV